jgi:hypothetical protein
LNENKSGEAEYVESEPEIGKFDPDIVYKFIPTNFNAFIKAIVIAIPNIGFQGIAGNLGALSLI